jgi:2-dehydro-3-deoxyglucarate aldolase
MKKQIYKINNLRKKTQKKYSLGCWLQIPSIENLEIILENKFDWFCIDYEHGFISHEKLGEMISLINKSNKIPIVRLSSTKPEEALNIIEAGALGLIIPRVKSSNEVKKIINICNYPPSGSRGIGFSRANQFGKSLNDQIKKFKPLIVPMIETKAAVENLDKILRLDGLDAVFIGPYDLSASYNIVGKFNSKKFQNILSNIKKKCDLNKIPCGVHVVKPNKNELEILIKKKYKFLAYTMDSVIIQNFYQNPL